MRASPNSLKTIQKVWLGMATNKLPLLICESSMTPGADYCSIAAAIWVKVS